MNKIHKIAFCIGVIFLAGCSQFIKVDPPKNQLIKESVFSNDETAIGALIGLYHTMSVSRFSYIIPLYTGLAGDELNTWSNLTSHQQLFQNALQPLDAASNELWNTAYKLIYQANAIIEGCNQSEILTPAVKQQLIGEALFIRAFWHFYLLNFFGDIPLLLTTNYEENASLGRSASTLVYNQIIQDLKIAEENLNLQYVSLNSVSSSTERIRPNKFAARALMARVYLYMGDFDNASITATSIIDQQSSYDIVGIGEVFLTSSKEAIWQLAMDLPSYNNNNTWEGTYFVLTSRPMNNAFNSSTASELLLHSFEEGDLRKDSWIGRFIDSSTEPTTTYDFLNKYKITNSSSIIERTVVLRLAEQYLIRAESRAQQNDFEGALQDLNVLRKRAGLKLYDLSNVSTKEMLLTFLLHERRVELFGEWGHRWLDLKRTRMIDEVMTSVAIVKGSNWDTSKALWPIPQQEIDRNSLLN